MTLLTRYEVRIAGRIDETATAALVGLTIVADGQVTVVSGEFDQAGLQGLLERIRMLGLELIEARRVRVPATAQATAQAAVPTGGQRDGRASSSPGHPAAQHD